MFSAYFVLNIILHFAIFALGYVTGHPPSSPPIFSLPVPPENFLS